MVVTTANERIAFFDVLRGVALFGILLVNVFSFGADATVWTDPLNRTFWALKHILFESKFWALYSLLFGMGFYLQSLSPGYTLGRAVRRLLVLMALGCLHGLLFEGDILMLYAELGLLLLVLNRLPNHWLVCVGVVLSLSFPLGHLFGGDRGDEWPPEDRDEAIEWLENDLAHSPLSIGDFADVLTYHRENIPELFWADWQYPDSGLLVLSFFLGGVVFMRVGWPRLQSLSMSSCCRVAASCWLAGFSLMGVERYLAATMGYQVFGKSTASALGVLVGDVVYLCATISLTGAWFISVWCWTRSDRFIALRTRVASAGRVSLSAYLSQTLVFTTVFYGYGLGKAFQWGPFAVCCFAVMVYLTQLVVCHWWCQRFRLGPMEWLWRSLTNLRWESIR
ncbi:MAG: DUF418 domain-containing protein [Halieaceae bacterium]|nr:DUF418 domain-containing protein [Halieaceae bacterium]